MPKQQDSTGKERRRKYTSLSIVGVIAIPISCVLVQQQLVWRDYVGTSGIAYMTFGWPTIYVDSRVEGTTLTQLKTTHSWHYLALATNVVICALMIIVTCFTLYRFIRYLGGPLRFTMSDLFSLLTVLAVLLGLWRTHQRWPREILIGPWRASAYLNFEPWYAKVAVLTCVISVVYCSVFATSRVARWLVAHSWLRLQSVRSDSE